MTAPAAPALAPVPSLGVVLVGCPDCQAVIGVDHAPGLGAALAAHRHDCPKRPRPHGLAAVPTQAPTAVPDDDVCPRCHCEAELYPHGSGDGWRCGDCLAEQLFDDLGGPPQRRQVVTHPAPLRRHRGEDQAAADVEPAEVAVA
jgi:hypothetical protein